MKRQNPARPLYPNKTTKSRRALQEHRSILALMQEALPGETAASVIKRKCRAIADRAKKLGWMGPPFDPEILASINGVTVEATDEAFEGDGRIFPRRGKVVIQYRTGAMLERRRFTICHELAHTCFPDVFEFVRNQSSEEIDDAAHRKFENLCDIGAAELLMPHSDFGADLVGFSACMGRVDFLRKRYIASIDATIKRLLDLTAHPCSAAFLTDEAFKTFSSLKGRMRVKYSWKSNSFRGFIPTGTLVPNGSCTLIAPLDAQPEFSGSKETWWVNNRPYSWYVEPLRLPLIEENREYPKVVALIHSRRPVRELDIPVG